MCRSGIKHVAKRYILFLVTARVYCYYIFTLRNIGTCAESAKLNYCYVCLSHFVATARARLKHQTQEHVKVELL